MGPVNRIRPAPLLFREHEERDDDPAAQWFAARWNRIPFPLRIQALGGFRSKQARLATWSRALEIKFREPSPRMGEARQTGPDFPLVP